MINDILTLASSKSIETDQPLEKVQIQPVMHQVIESFAEEAKNQQVTVKFAAPSKPITAMATENGLNTVMGNLIGNAIKYSKPGGTVEVEIHKEPEHVKISVSDTGIGIPEEDIPHIGMSSSGQRMHTGQVLQGQDWV